MKRYWQILRSQPRPVLFLLSRLLMRTGLCRLFLIRQQGFVLRFYPSALSATLWMAPDDRHADADFMRAYLRPGDVAIDVGANIGWYSLLAAGLVGGDGRVVGVEPNPDNCGLVERSAKDNGFTTITVVPAAASRPWR